MIYNPDGSPMTDSQKSSEVRNNKSEMASISSKMSSASSYYSKGQSLLASYSNDQNSMASDPFVLDKNSKKRSNRSDVQGIKSIQHNTLVSARALSNSYDNLKSRNDVLVNGTIGSQIVQSESAQRALDSQQAVKLNIQNNPQFSMSYSASVSASASFADLPQSKQTSLLNSYANAERNRKTESMFGYQGQNLPTGTLNAMQNGTYNEANNSKRGSKK